jgi:hypothetical protein
LTFRAISVPLTGGDQDRGRAVLVAIVLALLTLDVGVDGLGDGLVGAGGLVLEDHRGALAVVAHAGDQVPECDAALRGELASGMAQVVEVQACMPIDATARGQADATAQLVFDYEPHPAKKP